MRIESLTLRMRSGNGFGHAAPGGVRKWTVAAPLRDLFPIVAHQRHDDGGYAVRNVEIGKTAIECGPSITLRR